MSNLPQLKTFLRETKEESWGGMGQEAGLYLPGSGDWPLGVRVGLRGESGGVQVSAPGQHYSGSAQSHPRPDDTWATWEPLRQAQLSFHNPSFRTWPGSRGLESSFPFPICSALNHLGEGDWGWPSSVGRSGLSTSLSAHLEEE